MVAYPVTRHLMAQTRQLRPISARINSVRALSYTPTSIRLAQKDAQHKDSLNPRSTEYSKSGSDDDAARVQETAFDSDKTSPEEQMNHAEGEASKVGQPTSPLDASPANHDISQPRGFQEGQPENSKSESEKSTGGRERTSGGGSPTKKGGAKGSGAGGGTGGN
ncbi:hypothetical protein H2203_003515 [Taxawa tesnikishii (nom. ined.)]|nr:hypothetical protein H2203_003515 [Dothideales sp. JES 119]